MIEMERHCACGATLLIKGNRVADVTELDNIFTLKHRTCGTNPIVEAPPVTARYEAARAELAKHLDIPVEVLGHPEPTECGFCGARKAAGDSCPNCGKTNPGEAARICEDTAKEAVEAYSARLATNLLGQARDDNPAWAQHYAEHVECHPNCRWCNYDGPPPPYPPTVLETRLVERTEREPEPAPIVLTECTGCGYPVSPTAHHCPHCGYCPNCGYQFDPIGGHGNTCDRKDQDGGSDHG